MPKRYLMYCKQLSPPSPRPVEVKRSPTNSPHHLLLTETVGSSAPIPTCLSIKTLRPLTLLWLHLPTQWPLSRHGARTSTSSLPTFTFIPPPHHTCIDMHANGVGKQQLEQHSAPAGTDYIGWFVGVLVFFLELSGPPPLLWDDVTLILS